MTDSACTPIAKQRQSRRLPLANSTNSTTTIADSSALKKPSAAANRAAGVENCTVDSNQAVNQFTPTSRAVPRPAVASAPTNLKKNEKNPKNGSFFNDLCTPVGSAQRPMEIVSALTVDRVRAHFVTKSSPFGPLLPLPAGGRKYSQAALLILKHSPLIHAGDDVPVGPWSPGRVTRSARPAVSNARVDDSVKNLSALFEASTIEATKPTEVEEEEEGVEVEVEEKQEPIQAPTPTADSPAPSLTAECIEKRQKQIDITKQTPIYLAYVNRRSRAERIPSDPRTPRVTQRCSKRAWLGQLAKWRRDLHALSNATSTSSPSTPLKPLTLAAAASAREFSPAQDLAMPTS